MEDRLDLRNANEAQPPLGDVDPAPSENASQKRHRAASDQLPSYDCTQQDRLCDAINPPFNGQVNSQIGEAGAHLPRQPTPPPPYHQRIPALSGMTEHPYSARVSSLSHHDAVQYRSLDRRKEEYRHQDEYGGYSSDEYEEKEDRHNLYTDPSPNYDLEDPFPSPKGSDAKVSYPFPRDRPGGPTKPLISFVKNDWQHKKSPRSSSPSPADEDICPPGWSEILCSRAFKRWLVLYLLLMLMVWTWWFKFYGPEYVEDNYLKESLIARSKTGGGHFGMNRRVSFAGLIQLKQLDRRLVPGSDVDGVKKRRLVIVGDIHGCIDEREFCVRLQSHTSQAYALAVNHLLDRTKFDSQKDHLIATGDAISKGPSSSAVLDVLLLNNASSVRGNHEDKILLAHRDHHAPSHQKYVSSSDPNPSVKPGPITLKQGARDDLDLAASLTNDQIRYITSWPLILSLGDIPGMGNVSVVHAGLAPAVPLLQQDPISVMNMRSIDLRNHVPSPHHAPVPGVDPPDVKNRDSRNRIAIKPWSVLWNAWQEMQPKSERQTVVYGHDSKKGVVQGPWSLGLDGGCVKGGKLAALVIEEAGKRDVRKQVVSVPCKDYTAQKVLRPLGEN